MTGSKWVDQWTSGTVYGCSEIAGSPQSYPQHLTMSVVKPEGGPAASVKPGQKSCVRSSRVITLSVRQPSDGSRRSPPQTRLQWSITSGHQCSETTLTGKSRFHVSTPLGIEPGSLMTGSKWVDHWTSGTVYECGEIAGSPQADSISWYHNSVSVYRWRIVIVLYLFVECSSESKYRTALLG